MAKIPNTARLTRWLLNSHFNSNGIRPNAFMPRKYPDKISVNNTSNMEEGEIWVLCKKTFRERKTNRPVNVPKRADLIAEKIRKINLDGVHLDVFEAPTRKNELHCTINIPKIHIKDEERQEARRLGVAQKLINISTLKSKK